MKNMKLVYTFILTLFIFCFVGCNDSEKKVTDYLFPEKGSNEYFEQGISFNNTATSQDISFNAGQPWSITLTGENATSWCQISPTKGNAGKNTITITTTNNDMDNARTATLIITSGSQNKKIKITQDGQIPQEIPTGLSWTPQIADADQALTIIYKETNNQSILYGCTDDIYVHIGIGTDDPWEHGITTWGQNEAKFKMTSIANNTWKLSLTPSIREWFGSGTLPLKKIALVIRNANADKQTTDLFIPVTDNKYKGFEPAAIKKATLPDNVKEGINIINNTTVTFVLYDKDKNGESKDYAHIIGDFNNWTLANDETSQMNRDDAAGCWWITINNLDADKEYAFQYYVGDKEGNPIRIGDPYCEKILDPNNDKYIPASTYADNMTYPEKAKGIVSVFKIQKDNYTWSVSDFQIESPEKLVIYELHLRDFTSTGDIKGAKEKLSYLKEMGINAIELMPTQEFDGNDSWGYNPCYFFAMDKAYGTKNDYKDFIDACHKEGIAVILDVVYNHATGEFPHAKMYWNASVNKTATNNPFFNVDAPHPYSVFHDFNHENEWVRAYVKRNLKFLLEEYKLDGFRFDLTKGFTQTACTESNASNYDNGRIAILKDYNTAIKETKANAYVILEHFCDNKEEQELAEAGMHMWRNLNNAYCQTAMGYSSDSDFSGMYESTPAWVGFMESHDEERMAYKQSQWGDGVLKTDLKTRMKQLELNAAFALTVPGPKMIWQFGEMGYDISIEENGRTGRKPLHWEYLNNEYRGNLQETYTQLLKLRNEHPTLFIGSAALEWQVSSTYWSQGRTLHLTSIDGKQLVVLGNFTHTEATITFPAETGEWTEWGSNESQQVDSTVKVPANDYVIYTQF